MKHVASIFGILLITVAFSFFVFGEVFILDGNPPNLSNTDVSIEQWKASFQTSAFICIGAALTASLLWYGLAQWVFKINKSGSARKRLIWGLLFLLPIGAAILGVLSTMPVESGFTLGYVFFFIDGVFCYWLATLLFSPSSFKYTPLYSKVFRRW